MPYTLQKYNGKNTRYTCPSCKKQHKFTRYINTETGEYLSDYVGICDRINNCGYHYTPKDYFRDNPNTKSRHFTKNKISPITQLQITKNSPPSITETTYIPRAELESTLHHPQNNNLLIYLSSIFPSATVQHLTNIYQIGTHYIHGGGTTIFWQIDTNNKIRSGKLIKYDSRSGHRIKDLHTNWYHAVQTKYKPPNKFNLRQCLFGEHLLQYDTISSVAIVESEKTAIIAMALYPQFLWLATGSLHEFKPSKLQILKNRRVVAFPDIGAYNHWQKKAATLPFKIEISSYLEHHSNPQQKQQGLDIADFII